MGGQDLGWDYIRTDAAMPRYILADATGVPEDSELGSFFARAEVTKETSNGRTYAIVRVENYEASRMAETLVGEDRLVVIATSLKGVTDWLRWRIAQG